jgi:phosphinothricin acetyltransferase
MVAGIESGNTASIQLHLNLGFQNVGRMNEVGAKFGKWLDLTFLQLQLDHENSPPAR